MARSVSFSNTSTRATVTRDSSGFVVIINDSKRNKTRRESVASWAEGVEYAKGIIMPHREQAQTLPGYLMPQE